jgi:uncharacterized membrane protein
VHRNLQPPLWRINRLRRRVFRRELCPERQVELRMRSIALPLAGAGMLLLAACGKQEEPAGKAESVADRVTAAATANGEDTAPYSGIAEDETVHFTGTEPFWGGEVAGKTLTYKTPEHQDGDVVVVERFAGRGGISFSGAIEGAELEMTVTPLECSDGMSDRTYPFTVTLKLADETRNGCGWTERQPFSGPAHP